MKERRYVCLMGLPLDSPLLKNGHIECKPILCSRFYWESDWKEGHKKCYLRRWDRSSGETPT